jgi:hypothetical protein
VWLVKPGFMSRGGSAVGESLDLSMFEAG